MELLIWILLGMTAGAIVTTVMHDDTTLVGFIDIFLGVVGAVIAGLLTNMFTMRNVAGLYDQTILLAVIGAGILIWLGRTIIVKNQ